MPKFRLTKYMPVCEPARISPAARSGLNMTQLYRIYGIEVSPYSVKVRSNFRHKGIPHQCIPGWRPRSLARSDQAEGVVHV